MDDTTERVITLHPEREAGQRWEGSVPSDPPDQTRHWVGGSCESVAQQMDTDLGPLPDDRGYRVVEGGGA